MIIDRDSIENLVGTKISKIDLYQKAFTHKSALKENESLQGSFETLEFIGDSVLGFVITKPNTESPINSSVSNEPCKDSFSFNADLCVNAFWYKSILDIFVPTRFSIESLSIIMFYYIICIFFLSKFSNLVYFFSTFV